MITLIFSLFSKGQTNILCLSWSSVSVSCSLCYDSTTFCISWTSMQTCLAKGTQLPLRLRGCHQQTYKPGAIRFLCSALYGEWCFRHTVQLLIIVFTYGFHLTPCRHTVWKVRTNPCQTCPCTFKLMSLEGGRIVLQDIKVCEDTLRTSKMNH